MEKNSDSGLEMSVVLAWDFLGSQSSSTTGYSYDFVHLFALCVVQFTHVGHLGKHRLCLREALWDLKKLTDMIEYLVSAI